MNGLAFLFLCQELGCVWGIGQVKVYDEGEQNCRSSLCGDVSS